MDEHPPGSFTTRAPCPHLFGGSHIRLRLLPRRFTHAFPAPGYTVQFTLHTTPHYTVHHTFAFVPGSVRTTPDPQFLFCHHHTTVCSHGFPTTAPLLHRCGSMQLPPLIWLVRFYFILFHFYCHHRFFTGWLRILLVVCRSFHGTCHRNHGYTAHRRGHMILRLVLHHAPVVRGWMVPPHTRCHSMVGPPHTVTHYDLQVTFTPTVHRSPFLHTWIIPLDDADLRFCLVAGPHHTDGFPTVVPHTTVDYVVVPSS